VSFSTSESLLACADSFRSNIAGPEGVEWNKVVRDAVDYDAAIKAANIPQSEWDAILGSKTAQPAPTQPAPVPEVPEVKPTTTAAAPPAEPTGDKPKPKPTEPAPPKESQPSSGGGGGGNVLEALGCAKGQNAQEPNGKIWIGDSGSKTQMTFTNDADEDSAIICWDFETMFSVKSKALIAVPVGAGQSITLSLAPSFSGGCGPAYADSGFHNPSGILNESILEFTTAPETPDMYVTGVYDVSKEVNMDGVVISATGNRQCTSGVKDGAVSCLFGCVGGAKSCEATGTYGITAGNDESGMCNVGVDTYGNGGASGGCQFEPSGDHLKVTYSNNRSWPAATY
jgi:hypothetical protein